MPEVGRHEFEVGVLLYPEADIWIAQGIQYDITARGRNPDEASERFSDKFGAEFIISIEVGDSPVFAGVGPAPEKFRSIYYEQARAMADGITGIQIEGGRGTSVRRDIRIVDSPLAA